MDSDTKSRRELLKSAGVLAAGTTVAAVLPAKVVEAAAKGDVARWAMVLDMRRCIGCRACTVACKAEFSVPLGRWNAVVKQVETGSFPNVKKAFIPRLCNHCSGGDEKDSIPPCVKDCPEAKSGDRAKMNGVRYRTGATYKRPDGVIFVDNTFCIGCGKCIKACPYGVRYFDPSVKLTRKDREADHGIGKCSFCSHRIANGVVPSCVNTCPGNARIFGDLNDPSSEVSKLVKKFNLVKQRDKTTILPKEETMPYVFYIDPDNALKDYTFDHKDNDKKLAEFRDILT